MAFHYSTDKNVQMLLYILKKNNIKRVIVSPGSMHFDFVGSVQQDSDFEVFSAVDERGAAFMACGMATESNEPVVITCTGSTASRNYMPGLTEAFYRKLPIIVVTGTQPEIRDGNLSPQFVDRSVHPNDTVKLSVQIGKIRNQEDEFVNNLKLNKAILEATRRGGGPVHINLITTFDETLSVNALPVTRVIHRYVSSDHLPQITNNIRIAISVGAHKYWSKELTDNVERFCEKFNAIVFIDHSSNYHGKYRILPTIAVSQEKYTSFLSKVDLLIHMGEQSGDYYMYNALMKDVKEVWRVSIDGEVRDTFMKLTSVFEMEEIDFFKAYLPINSKTQKNISFYEEAAHEIDRIYSLIPEIPFSNVWLCQNLANLIPQNAAIHIGMSNSQRSLTFFELPESVFSIGNVGTRGIDGALSTVIGMSLVDKERIHYCLVGDLTFFYNLNALGNRHVGPNLRFILINNDGGAEFNLYQNRQHQMIGDKVNDLVAASGHSGHKSPTLVRHIAEDLGYEYLVANNKQEAQNHFTKFFSDKPMEKPMIFELFTNKSDESDAVYIMRHLLDEQSISDRTKSAIKGVLGEKGIRIVKKIIK